METRPTRTAIRRIVDHPVAAVRTGEEDRSADDRSYASRPPVPPRGPRNPNGPRGRSRRQRLERDAITTSTMAERGGVTVAPKPAAKRMATERRVGRTRATDRDADGVEAEDSPGVLAVLRVRTRRNS